MAFDGKRDDDPFDFDAIDRGPDNGPASSSSQGGSRPGQGNNTPPDDPFGFGDDDPFADTSFPGDLSPEELQATSNSPFQNGPGGYTRSGAPSGAASGGARDDFGDAPRPGAFSDMVQDSFGDDDEPDFGPRRNLDDIFPQGQTGEDDIYGKEPARARKKWPILVGLGAIALFGGIIYYAYTGGGGTVDPDQAPLVAGDNTPWRYRPEDRGGERPEHQDKLIYQNTLTEGNSGNVERLLPPPEAPVSPLDEPVTAGGYPAGSAGGYNPEAGDSVLAAVPDEGMAPAYEEVPGEDIPPIYGDGSTLDNRDVVNLPPPDGSSATILEPSPADTARNVVAETPAPRPAAPARPATQTASRSSTSTADSGDYRMQLSSLRSAADVQKKWVEWQNKHSDVLGGLSLNIQKADLGSSRGVYYRMKTNGMPKGTAQSKCNQLKSRGLDCIVTRK